MHLGRGEVTYPTVLLLMFCEGNITPGYLASSFSAQNDQGGEAVCILEAEQGLLPTSEGIDSFVDCWVQVHRDRRSDCWVSRDGRIHLHDPKACTDNGKWKDLV